MLIKEIIFDNQEQTTLRELIALVEKFWDKYAVSMQQIEDNRANTMDTLNGYLKKLRDLG